MEQFYSAESTANPIWLLQKKVEIWDSQNQWGLDDLKLWSAEHGFKDLENPNSDWDQETLEKWNYYKDSLEILKDIECVPSFYYKDQPDHVGWDTVGVFYSRQDAEDLIKLQPYRYGELNKDSRVYAISLHGPGSEDLALAIKDLRDHRNLS